MSATTPEQPDDESSKAIENEIQDLEKRLAQAKLRLKARNTVNGKTTHRDEPHAHSLGSHNHTPTISRAAPQLNPTTHFLLLLADSALPLGSFAFSSGLESYLAHARLSSSSSPLPFSSSYSSPPPASFDIFLPLSVSSYASTTLPFLLAAHRHPSQLPDLDDALDAAVICTVGKRASVAQGRALLGIWERSFFTSTSTSFSPQGDDQEGEGGSGGGDDKNKNNNGLALSTLASYAKLLRTPSSSRYDATGLPPVAAHLAPLFGVIASILGLSLQQTAYVFMLGHVKALVSAAVRANLMGPYAAQRVLSSGTTQKMIACAVEKEWNTPFEEAGQGVPVMDLWVGRHEVLYSRIFNS